MSHKMKCKIQIFLWLWAIIITITSNSQTNGEDPLLLNCGATGEHESRDSDGRKWIPDSNYLTTNNSLSSTAESQDPSLPSTVPYMTSRIFKSQTTYRFHISPTSRHWIRLHFYPSIYNRLNTAAAFFSVSAAAFTLLHNFSASLTAQAYIIREFTIPNLNSPLLDLTFTPSINPPNAFAFINGIEIIPMPEIFQSDHEAQAMQTMFRLNVGGRFIPAPEDSGLTRTWYDDSPYIYGAAYGVAHRADRDVAVEYPSPESKLAAPPDVYRTARSMGPNSTLNLNYNLTWILDVDENFAYLVRLHFCDFVFNKVNQMVFFIFINNQTVETDADIVGWAGGRGSPVYKDYVVYVRNGYHNLWLALHPNVESKPQFYDSSLNGIEVFKVSDRNGSLAAPNPIPYVKNVSHKATKSRSRSRKNGLIVAYVASVFASVTVVGLIVACLKQRNTRADGGASWMPVYGSSWSSKSSGSSSQISSLGKGLCRHFSIGEIRAATRGFSEACVVGVGGFGKVYRGCIDGNATEVAIKRANPSSQQGVHEFLNEIELLSKLRHRHLVSLIGACEENNEMVLVYDYMANGTLREHLYNDDDDSSTRLSWKQRLGICIGAARGIHYLHTGAKNPIIHRDVKTTNILLDQNWVAKVSDFGLSKASHALDQAHVSTAVKGSFGYLDPEYYRLQQLTDKSDVYSFGVVLFEVLCARPAINPTLPKEQLCLADWAVASYRKGAMEEMIDPRIRGEINPECLKHYIQTAVKCLSDDSMDRPSMAEVLRNLEHCLKLQSHESRQDEDTILDSTNLYT